MTDIMDSLSAGISNAPVEDYLAQQQVRLDNLDSIAEFIASVKIEF